VSLAARLELGKRAAQEWAEAVNIKYVVIMSCCFTHPKTWDEFIHISYIIATIYRIFQYFYK
jgi:hypothetical protein